MVTLRACFVIHKVARYNRVTLQSIRLRQDEDAARKAAESARSTVSATTAPSSAPIRSDPQGFASSLKESIGRRPVDLRWTIHMMYYCILLTIRLRHRDLTSLPLLTSPCRMTRLRHILEMTIMIPLLTHRTSTWRPFWVSKLTPLIFVLVPPYGPRLLQTSLRFTVVQALNWLK